jgi:hypothetical protein
MTGATMCITACLAVQGAGEKTRLDVRVVSVSGRSVYLSAGRDAGVEPGATVVIFLASGERIEARVIDVSSSSSRAELAEGATAPEVDARGEVLVSTPEPAPEPPAEKVKAVPEHPPWSRGVEARDESTPLLAPAFSTPPEQRPTRVRGRVFGNARFTHDTSGGTDSDYTFARVGTWIEVTNPFHEGGRVLFSGSFDARGADLADRDESTARPRIDRLSYAIGGHRFSPYRLEVGRFTSYSMPEIGTVDGVEARLQTEGGWSFGAGGGLYPASFPDRDTGDDFGFHMFAEYESGREGSVSSVIGYQQTWHQGAPDRNLLIGRVNYRASKAWWLYGMALVDLYVANDTVKDGAGVTQMVLQARYTPTLRGGGSVTYTHTTWAELQRKEYANLPAELLRDGRVDRLTLQAWHDLTKVVRLTGSLYGFTDQDGEGGGGDVGVEWRDPWAEASSLAATVFLNSAAFNNGVGARLQGTQQLGSWRVFGSYEVAQYTYDSMVQGGESTLRSTIRLDLGWSRGRWSADVDGSFSFGDGGTSLGLGLFLEYRF